MRTFISINLPEEFKAELAEAIRSLRQKYTEGINWVATENYHITFIFLGETSSRQIDRIKEIINETLFGLSCQKILIEKLEFIPRVNPRLFWLSARLEEKQLYIKWEKMREALTAEGFSLDSRELKLHITIARIKKRLPKYSETHFLTTELKSRRTNIEQISLMKSNFTSSGVKYDKLYSYELNK